MTLKDSQEMVKKIVETTHEYKELDEKRVLEQTKHDLQNLKTDLTYAGKVIEELQKAGRIDMSTKAQWEKSLNSPEEREKTIAEVVNKVEDIRSRFDTLGEQQKEKISKMADALRQSRAALSGLKEEVTESTDSVIDKTEEAIVGDVDAKMAKYPAWLREWYKDYIHRKMGALKWEKKQESGRWDQIKNTIVDGFFALVGWWLVGKEIADKIDNPKQLIDDHKERAEQVYEEIVDNWQEKMQEFSPEQLEVREKNFRNHIKVIVKKYGKDIDEATLSRVVKRMDVKKLANDKTAEIQKVFSTNRADANVVDMVSEWLLLPFYFGGELITALREEGVIEYSDIAFSAVGETVSYGLKWFKIFGSGMKVALGSVSRSNIGSEL